MKQRHTSRMVAFGLSLLAAGWLAPAWASNQWGPYSLEILVDGVPQPLYPSGGESFLAGSYGSAYEIRIHNQSGRRIEAVVAVDGRDVITGRPVSPGHHRGHIIGPYGQTSIAGFRSSTSQVATFRFSSIPASYAWRTGTSWGIGTIRVWIFEEAQPISWPSPPVVPYASDQARPEASSRQAPGRSRGLAAEAAPQAMGTAYGEQRWAPVSYTTFARGSSQPTAVLGIRYNSWEMLAAAGIVGAPTVPRPITCIGCWPYYETGPFAPPPPPMYAPVGF